MPTFRRLTSVSPHALVILVCLLAVPGEAVGPAPGVGPMAAWVPAAALAAGQDPKAGNVNPEVAKLKPEEIDAALEVVAAYSPALADKIRDLRRANPAKVSELLSADWKKLRPAVDLYKRDRELFKASVEDTRLTREIEEQVRDLAGMTDARKQEAARARLQEQLARRFDVRVEMEKRQLALFIADSQARIQAWQKRIEDRGAARDRTLADELKRLTKG